MNKLALHLRVKDIYRPKYTSDYIVLTAVGATETKDLPWLNLYLKDMFTFGPRWWSVWFHRNRDTT